jgi:hypothetical protein
MTALGNIRITPSNLPLEHKYGGRWRWEEAMVEGLFDVDVLFMIASFARVGVGGRERKANKPRDSAHHVALLLPKMLETVFGARKGLLVD